MTFSTKPTFIGWATLITQLPFQLFFTAWMGGFFGALTSSVLGHYSFLFFGALAFFGIPLIVYFGKKLNYARTEYRFYDDRLEFEEGFLTINKKVIKYKDVKEVTLRKGPFQRIYGLGTVYLATVATGTAFQNNIFYGIGFGNISASGIGVRDIQDPDSTYERTKTLVDKCNV